MTIQNGIEALRASVPFFIMPPGSASRLARRNNNGIDSVNPDRQSCGTQPD
jgi:hypothetical protein